MNRPTRHKYHNIAIGLAALLQTTEQIAAIARTGRINSRLFETSLRSLFCFDAPTPEAIYGRLSHLESGLITLLQAFDEGNQEVLHDISPYLFSLIYLQRKVMKTPKAKRILPLRLQSASQKADFLGTVDHPELIETLANLYLEITQEHTLRIQIVGQREYLSNSSHLARIRALLLAGLRASTLWEQVGGRKWQFLFAKNKLITATRELLDEWM